MNDSPSAPLEPRDFIRAIVAADQAAGVYGGQVITRFPPEPNGFLHIGHAKSIALNFGLAAEFGGRCHLRFDDTNPETEDMRYVESIQADIRWLGYDWGQHLYFASDYFAQLYQFAETLIQAGQAYVDSLNEQEIREYRGAVTEPGRESPYRNRSVAENLDLFRRMRAGEFADGAHVLRAKGDMASANMKMRDPLLYRIRHASHYRTGDAWCIYPMYDFAHPLSDAIEGITHSICTLEFENNRAIYDWLMDNLLAEPRPHQHEFARLALDYTVMSKRKLLQLVEEGYVSGWDDPRMPTLSGLRRRGVTPEAIRAFAERVGVAKVNSRIEMELLEHTIRDDLNFRAPRVMCVLRPLKVVIENYPPAQAAWLDAGYWPREIARSESRPLPFARELFIEQEDFAETPPPGWKRLSPGGEVRLRHAYVIRCDRVIKNAGGEIVELRCSYDPATLNAQPQGRKIQGAIHWVAAAQSLPAQVRLYDRLFLKADPDDLAPGQRFTDALNPTSLITLDGARVEPSILHDPADTRYQFERQGYFMQDALDSRPDALVFNRIIGLRDSWGKQQGDGERQATPAPVKTMPQLAAAADTGSLSAARSQARAADAALAAAFRRLQAEWGLPEQDADLLSGDAETLAFFEAALAAHPDAQAVANWMNNALQGALGDATLSSLSFGGAALGRLAALVEEGVLSATIAKDVLAEMVQRGADPDQIVAARGLRQISDAAALAPIIARVIAENPEKVAAYRSGRPSLIGFFMGQVMRHTGGKANPQLARELMEQALG